MYVLATLFFLGFIYNLFKGNFDDAFVGLAIAIILGVGRYFWNTYKRRKDTVEITIEQAELVSGLVRKEMAKIEKKRQDIIDNAAADGKTVSIESIFSNIEGQSDELFNRELEKQKQELLNKYGPNIPVGVVYKLIKQWDPDT
jgi:hypothetical protein